LKSRFSRWAQGPPRLATWIGIALYSLFSLTYIILGEANSDEGWYLYASKLVFSGALPYRDFAYTQMPLLPYIYGVVQVIRPSLMLGRLTSLAFSLGTLAMCLVIVKRCAGSWAVGVSALFLGTFTFGIYFNAIVKTYSLLTFFFTATLFVLTSNQSETPKFLIALFFALAAFLTRVTALFFLAPTLLYLFIVAKTNLTRALIALEGAAAALLTAFFLLPDWQAARWDLFDSHFRHWAGAGLSTQVYHILADRLPYIIQSFSPPLILFIASVYFLLRQPQSRLWLRQHLHLLVFTLCLALFASSHLVNGLWETEYLVPALTAFLPIAAIVLEEVNRMLDDRTRVFMHGALLAAILLLPLNESIQHIDITGRRLPIAEIDQVASLIAQNSNPTDKVIALEALGAAVDANRSTLPGLTLAEFSVQLMEANTARQYHVVNVAMLAEEIEKATAAVVVLTDQDWGLLYANDAPSADAMQHAIDRNYRLALSVTYWGGFADTVSVYLRNPGLP
jgi:4-amino-4-deoxy-L-arabinose transferase-like glycosyltransferase